MMVSKVWTKTCSCIALMKLPVVISSQQKKSCFCRWHLTRTFIFAKDQRNLFASKKFVDNYCTLVLVVLRMSLEKYAGGRCGTTNSFIRGPYFPLSTVVLVEIFADCKVSQQTVVVATTAITVIGWIVSRELLVEVLPMATLLMGPVSAPMMIWAIWLQKRKTGIRKDNDCH